MSVVPQQRWIIFGAYALLVLGLSIMPSAALDGVPEFFLHQDKLAHALVYGGWAVLLSWAWQGRRRWHPLAWPAGIVALAAAYGVFMELLQALLTCSGRTCSWGDMLANLTGAVLGVGLYVAFVDLRHRNL